MHKKGIFITSIRAQETNDEKSESCGAAILERIGIVNSITAQLWTVILGDLGKRDEQMDIFVRDEFANFIINILSIL